MRFIGVSFGVIDQKLVAIATSQGNSACEPEGFTTQAACEFLASISLLKQSRETAFVCYESAVDCELLLRDLTPHQKDILFGLYREKENQNQESPLFDPSSAEYRGIIRTGAYTISLCPGKILRLRRDKQQGIVLYDIAAFFDCELNPATRQYLRKEIERLDRQVLPLWSVALIESVLDRCEREAELIAELAGVAEKIIAPLTIDLRQWYGPSAVAGRCLHKWGARREAKRLTEKNSAHELLRAIDCAYFGGRVELLKLGTIKGVNAYDLNSAYAYAITLLSRIYAPAFDPLRPRTNVPLRFTRRYDQAAPFACWFVRYELPKDIILGVLPHRQPLGSVVYKRIGRGYFWAPEVDYLRQCYPGCFDVLWGYQGEYKQVSFASNVEAMYDYRCVLKAEGNPGEQIIKLSLAALYGKFAQNAGDAYFQCRAWAGWITSFIRRMLLDAVTGIENDVICFCQDAIHLANGALAKVPLSQRLGEWKLKQFASGLYIAPGFYELYDSDEFAAKAATRGSNSELNFARLATDLSERQATELSRLFFVGWSLARKSLKFQRYYLSEIKETLNLIPAKLRARDYRETAFDWQNDSRGSGIGSIAVGRDSRRYIPGQVTGLRLKLKDRGWLAG